MNVLSIIPFHLLIHPSMSSPQIPSSMLAALAMTNSPTSSGMQTNGRVSQKPISSRAASRRAPAQSSSQVITGNVTFMGPVIRVPSADPAPGLSSPLCAPQRSLTRPTYLLLKSHSCLMPPSSSMSRAISSHTVWNPPSRLPRRRQTAERCVVVLKVIHRADLLPRCLPSTFLLRSFHSSSRFNLSSSSLIATSSLVTRARQRPGPALLDCPTRMTYRLLPGPSRRSPS